MLNDNNVDNHDCHCYNTISQTKYRFICAAPHLRESKRLKNQHKKPNKKANRNNYIPFFIWKWIRLLQVFFNHSNIIFYLTIIVIICENFLKCFCIQGEFLFFIVHWLTPKYVMMNKQKLENHIKNSPIKVVNLRN